MAFVLAAGAMIVAVAGAAYFVYRLLLGAPFESPGRSGSRRNRRRDPRPGRRGLP